MTRMQINGSETGVVRLFHLDLPPEAVERFTTQAGTGEWPLQYALGARRLRPAFVDVVSIRDLGEMSLSRYLEEAHQASGPELSQLRPQLDRMKGHVVILPSQAFDHVTQDLVIAAPLRWVASFDEVHARQRGPALRSRSARGSGSGRPVPAGPPQRGLALKLVLGGFAVVAVLLAAALLRSRL